MLNGFDKLKGRYILLIFLIYIIFNGLIAHFFSFIGMDKIGDVSKFILDITLVVLLFWILIRYRIKIRNLFGRIPVPTIWPKVFGLLILLGFFSVSVGVFQEYLFPSIHPGSEEFYGLYNFSDPVSLIINNMSIVILVPLIEELIFRSVLIHRWSRKWSTRTAVILSAIIFGVGHLDPIGAFTFGIVASLLYIKTKSLWVPLAAHAFNNFIVSLIVIYVATAYTPEASVAITSTDLLISGIIILITLPPLIYFIRRNWPTKYEKLPYYMNRLED